MCLFSRPSAWQRTLFSLGSYIPINRAFSYPYAHCLLLCLAVLMTATFSLPTDPSNLPDWCGTIPEPPASLSRASTPLSPLHANTRRILQPPNTTGNIESPLDTSRSGQARRNAAVKIIQEKFGEAKVGVLDPQQVLRDYDAISSANKPDSVAAAAGFEDRYNCVTEKFEPGSVASILVGLFTEIPRWKPGSTIKFAAYTGGYPQPGDAQFAALRLWEAAQQWNSYDLGVSFDWVGNLEDAAFVLEYGGDKGAVLARAFFPNSNPLNTLSVYRLALLPTQQYRGMLKNIFLHELGHTLGLRHEFALDPERWEGGAVVYGSKNDKSVMSYLYPPQMQPSDITDTKNFYALRTLVVGRLTLKDYMPG
ncbi:zincin [Parathielavia appendiculata]|uniref:Zincin n=1 Tax=Parathielavia appendiculata TaxID=2587402 RepID=A0AAN6YZC7_9PEZI|nr:zincin [Parathielavia appendiculata]